MKGIQFVETLRETSNVLLLDTSIGSPGGVETRGRDLSGRRTLRDSGDCDSPTTGNIQSFTFQVNKDGLVSAPMAP